MRRVLSYLVAMAAVLLGSYILYQFRDLTVSVPDISSDEMENADIQTGHLSNGMEVVVIPNHRVPAISHTIWLRVGAADDPLGKSGLAHYLEHLMFKGTPTVPSGEFSRTIERLGGNLNAFTSQDFTGYYVDIAKEHLETVMKLEADRFQHLSVPLSEYQKEREVIIEERRSRIDNSPAARLNEQANAVQFQHHPYRIPIIGWMHEMQALELSDAEAFYKEYYHPGNMVLVIAGDVNFDEVMPLAEHYYGSIPAHEPYHRHWVQEPEHYTSPLVVLRDEKVQQPRWSREYLAPTISYGETKDAMPLMLFSQWFGSGKTSLLYQELVVQQQLATGANVSYNLLGVGPSTLNISVTPAADVTMQQIEEAVDALIAKTLASPISASDLTRVKTLMKADVIYARDGLSSIAQFVGMLRMTGQDASLFNKWTSMIEAVDAPTIQNAARDVLSAPYVTSELLPPKEMMNVSETAVQAVMQAPGAVDTPVEKGEGDE